MSALALNRACPFVLQGSSVDEFLVDIYASSSERSENFKIKYKFK